MRKRRAPAKKRVVSPAERRTVRPYRRLVQSLIQVIESGRFVSGRVVNQAMTATYWMVGRRIVEHEQQGARRAGYGEELITALSADLAERFGDGFSPRNLAQMRAFYLWKRILQTPSAKLEGGEILQTVSAKLGGAPAFPLPWSHYNRLLSVRDEEARGFYEAEAIASGWSVRQLDRQIASLAFQRTKGRSGKVRGEPVEIDEVVRDPLVLEFLGLKDEYSETELEEALIVELEKFLLELGKGYAFVGRQRRLRVGDEWYRVDLVFFHRHLRCLVIIDLKIGKFHHADVGQMNLYLNYAQEHWTNPGENPPIGVILCSDKDSAVAHYAMGGMKNKMVASQFQLTLPDQKKLGTRLSRVRRMLGK